MSDQEHLQFEISRHVLKKVSKAIKSDNKADATWLKKEFINPSTEYGVPITVDSYGHELSRIQKLWNMAVEAEPSIEKEGALILNAKKNGTEVVGINLSKYGIKPNAVQFENATPTGSKPTQQYEPNSTAARHPTLTSVHAAASPSDGIKAESSPTAISPTSSLRSSSSPEVPDIPMMHPRPFPTSQRASHVGEPERSDGKASMLSSRQQSARPPPGQVSDTDKAPRRRRRRYSGSTTYSAANTTVTFQANITTGGNVSAIPFSLDNINEAIDDIIAYVDWKNSEGGRRSAVGFKDFLDISNFRSSASNALVLRKTE
ncbi:Zygote arrest protein 1 [Lasiodiplodia theobromae]|uniref:Zygote arrest protein 1 n=1 Tax=Lasiodiplodia theobromae TaxID=45133 RepID=UPI0015C3AC62|nr:Zygote arrest protein 1 [Lasiodiplodia theobromae]KAF4544123.1 Zygote arrest protein 1 [Lasiodiplodia theobromae]